MSVVVNATPLIALSLVDRLELLPTLFGEVLTPPAVYAEVTAQGAVRRGAAVIARAQWLQVKAPTDLPTIEPLLFGIDLGEMQVLLLAREIAAEWVIIDELLGRRVARALHLPVKGTLGVFLAAHYAGRMSATECRIAVSSLTATGIRLSASLIQWFNEQLSP